MSSLVESKFTLYAVIVKVWSALKFEIEKNHFVPKYVEPKFHLEPEIEHFVKQIEL